MMRQPTSPIYATPPLPKNDRKFGQKTPETVPKSDQVLHSHKKTHT